jgi:hypothetical protein
MVKFSKRWMWSGFLVCLCLGISAVWGLPIFLDRKFAVLQFRKGGSARFPDVLSGSLLTAVGSLPSVRRNSYAKSQWKNIERSAVHRISADAASTTCSSAGGVQVTWKWVNQTTGLIEWVFSNPTNSTRAVVLNRGATGTLEDVQSYTFGEAFAFAYLANGLACLDSGPYSPLGPTPASLPMGIIGKTNPIFGFIFTVDTNGTVTVQEGGFLNLKPYCDNLPDVSFLENAKINISYNLRGQCEDFYTQSGSSDYECVSNPFVHTWPVYQVTSGSMSGQDYIIVEDGTSIAFLNTSGESSSSVGLSCFPGEAWVVNSKGKRVLLRDLQAGETIMTMALQPGGSAPHAVQTRFLGFLDRKPSEQTAFLRLELDGTFEALEVTADHLLPVVIPVEEEPLQRVKFIRARFVEPGSLVITERGSSARVQSIRSVVRKGAYGPLTEAGTLLVNNVLVSCYAHTDSHARAHGIMAPLRFASRFQTWLPRETFGMITAASERNGLHPYVRFLYLLRQRLQILGSRLPILRIFQETRVHPSAEL